MLKTGCWVDLLKALRTTLSLETMYLEHELLSQGSTWFCYDCEDHEQPTVAERPNMLVGKLEEYIVTGGVFPLHTRSEVEDVEQEWSSLSDKSFNLREGQATSTKWWKERLGQRLEGAVWPYWTE